MCFPTKLTLFLLVVLVLCVLSPSKVCCTVYPLFRCVCWWNPYVSWLSPMWVLWVDVRIFVGYQCPMFVNGLLYIFFLLSWLTSSFSCFSPTSRFPDMKETSAANPSFYCTTSHSQGATSLRCHWNDSQSKGSYPQMAQMVLNQVMNSCFFKVQNQIKPVFWCILGIILVGQIKERWLNHVKSIVKPPIFAAQPKGTQDFPVLSPFHPLFSNFVLND